MSIVATTLRAPDNLISILKLSAKQEGHTLNALILQILWDWVKKNTLTNEMGVRS